MTIGVAASGENAGLAVWKALNRTEQVCHGSIGGFATFAILTSDGEAKHFATQRGGSKTLFTEGEEVLSSPPEEVAEAPIAGVISSGPDRPDPLSQFLPAADDVGLVTGHRIPNAPSNTDEPLNQRVLDLMREGMTSSEAVEEVISEHPSADAGLIALDADGNIAVMNTRRVENRPDVGHASGRENGAKVEVVNNEIHPIDLPANIARSIAIETMSDEWDADFQIWVEAGTPVEHGDEDEVHIDGNDVATRIVTTDPTILNDEQVGVTPYILSKVVKDGEPIGEVTNEALTVLEDGVIKELAGSDAVQLNVRLYE